jgi:hypothetical protein
MIKGMNSKEYFMFGVFGAVIFLAASIIKDNFVVALSFSFTLLMVYIGIHLKHHHEGLTK